MGGRTLYKKLLFLALTVIIGVGGYGVSASTVYGSQSARFAEKDRAAYCSLPDQGCGRPGLVLVGMEMGEGARNFIQSMANRGIEFLSNSAMSHEQKISSFEDLLKDSFDMNTIGRFSLGRYWRVATPEQRNEYQRLFEDMILKVYSQRFSDYKGQRFETRSFRVDSEKDTLVISYIVPEEGPEVEVEWRVRYKNGSYKVVDVIVEGVSMSVTQRSDFGSVIQRGGGNVQALLSYLRDEMSRQQ